MGIGFDGLRCVGAERRGAASCDYAATGAWLGAALAVIGLLAPISAKAQSASYFDRNNNVSVRDRPRPDYEASGVDVSSFVVYPKVTIGELYNTNIYASPPPYQGDNVLQISPEVSANSTWSRNALSFYARLFSSDYLSHGGESTQNYQLGSSGRLDVGTTTALNGSFSFAHSTEPRTSENTIITARSPIQYDQIDTSLGVSTQFTRLRLSGGVAFDRYAFYDTRDFAGNFLLQADRDENSYSAQARADYALTPSIAVFVSGVISDQVYDLKPPQVFLDRDSHGYTTTVGTDFDITRLTRGSFQIGYQDQAYNKSIYGSSGGLYTSGRIEYFATPLTTLTLSVSRSVQNAGDPRAISYTLSSVGLQADHELLRNVILSANVGYQNDTYHGIDRVDNRLNLGANATYLVNRHIGVNLGYNYLNNASAGTDRIYNYIVNYFSLSLVFQL